MNPSARYAWIVQYLKDRSTSLPYSVNVVDAYFVEAYLHATRAPFEFRHYGAHGCRQLGRDLSKMHAAGTLVRRRVGLGDMHSMGFPAWVWDYRLVVAI